MKFTCTSKKEDGQRCTVELYPIGSDDERRLSYHRWEPTLMPLTLEAKDQRLGFQFVVGAQYQLDFTPYEIPGQSQAFAAARLNRG